LAAILYLLLYRRRPLLVEHGVFSIHVFSFVLFSSLLFLPALELLQMGYATMTTIVIFAVVIIQFWYLTLAVRRFYLGSDTRRFRPLARSAGIALLIYLANSLFITALQLLGAAFALQTI
jgi:hypothetical protein